MNIYTDKYDDAYKLIMEHHYSKRWPSNIQKCITWHNKGGLFGDCGEAKAAIIFAIPPTRWKIPVWELIRLVRHPKMDEPLTKLISIGLKYCKKEIDLIVSFADIAFNHHGGIYQAASWQYAGKRTKSMDGILMDGQFIPGRSCNSLYGTRSPILLQQKFPYKNIQPHYDEGKHLYWKSLTKKGRKQAKELQLLSLPYPKPLLQEVLL